MTRMYKHRSGLVLNHQQAYQANVADLKRQQQANGVLYGCTLVATREFIPGYVENGYWRTPN